MLLQQIARRRAVLGLPVRVGPDADQEVDHARESVPRRGVQRRLARADRLVQDGAGPPVDGGPDGVEDAVLVAPFGDDQLGGDQPAAAGGAAAQPVADRGHQRRRAVVRPHERVRAGRGEHPRQLRLQVLGREQERRGALLLQREDEFVGPARHRGAAGEPGVGVGAPGQQHSDQRPVGAQDRRVQRAVAGAVRVGVGAAGEQELRQPRMAAHDGQRQRAVAVGAGLVDVGARVEQQAGGVDAAVARREQQRGEPPGVEVLGAGRARRAAESRAAELPPGDRAGVDGRPVLQQHGGDVRLPVRGGPHQGGLPVLRLGGVDLGAVLDERPRRRGVARRRAAHERRLTGQKPAVRIRAGRQQPLDDLGVAARARHPQGRGAEFVRRVDVGAGVDQPVHRAQGVPVRRPVQRRRAVTLRRVDVRALVQQGADPGPVAVLRRVGEPAVGTALGRAGRPRAAQHRHGRQPDTPLPDGHEHPP